MGLFSGLFGNASEADKEKVAATLEKVLIPGEQIELSYNILRDLVVFTSYRLILMDKQGVTGKKRDFMSIPYKSISRFSVESTGNFDIDAEVKIFLSGNEYPTISLQFKGGDVVFDVQRALAAAVLL
ncbi:MULTISPECIES: PH domain-containing protein [Aerococcus]|jgi:hypothetical protein|uniref:PH domain-containing protein n=1 Tax=Aerococcus agrisoli TaxID=2487350 RepID=A0A3N4GCF9_9LACT|nr:MULTISPECIES: PH domain-containing protein [Aerococcus]OYQ65895.1 helicase [Aerococcus sp. 1KP-2016]RPA60493.1 PH domain-containing protein [Aerococcus agrisoli]